MQTSLCGDWIWRILKKAVVFCAEKVSGKEMRQATKPFLPKAMCYTANFARSVYNGDLIRDFIRFVSDRNTAIGVPLVWARGSFLFKGRAAKKRRKWPEILCLFSAVHLEIDRIMWYNLFCIIVTIRRHFCALMTECSLEHPLQASCNQGRRGQNGDERSSIFIT